MSRRRARRRFAAVLILLASVAGSAASAPGPDHPIITEVYQNPVGNDGPVGRDPGNLHQEYIEIYLPPLADLDPGLDADSLELAFYEIEGDSSSFEMGLVAYRIDLPAFDLNPANGLTGLPRPPSGIVVLGWVDYVGNPPTGLAGTPSTRLGLVQGGITSATDFTFIAINGAQFGGTTNFPVPTAVSRLDLVTDPSVGIIEQGSAAYLLVDREQPGYTAFCAHDDPGPCDPFPDLPLGTKLAPGRLLDGFAGNDDPDFRVDKQPYDAPTGKSIDLEFVLPNGGAFSDITPQVPEVSEGYARILVDLVKTSEDAIPGNEDPVADAIATYRDIPNLGPLRPTPGTAASTTTAAELALGDDALQSFEVLTNTTSHPGLVAANAGGDFGLVTVTTPDPSTAPAQMTLASGSSTWPPIGQDPIAPEVGVETFPQTLPGHTQVVMVQVAASRAQPTDPAVVNPNDSAVALLRAIDPKTGLDALGQPFEATSFVALQGLEDVPGVANEFAATSLGQHVQAHLGGLVQDTRGAGLQLVSPTTDLSDPLVVDPLVATMPTLPAEFIERTGAPGTPSLVATVLGSAEVVSGTGTYDESFNPAQTRLQAREFLIAETVTRGGTFTPTERVHYANPAGNPGVLGSGLTNVVTKRDFELAFIDTQLGPTGVLETGATDDFGLVVEVGQIAPGSTFVAGEFIFLSFTGGLEGADVDSLDVPPHNNLATLVLVDLDPLDTELGVRTITRLFVVDGSGNGEVDVLEVFSLPEPGAGLSLLCGVATVTALALRRRRQPG